MVKSERIAIEPTEQPSGTPWLIGLAAWFVPGAGHLWLKRWGRALALGGAVWVSFILGLWMGGHMFSLSTGQGSSALLQIPPMIANMGSGALYLFCLLFGIGFLDDPQQAARATYEYGNTFLLIAGLLNYLAVLDAFDIAVRRKP
ncbi:MAG TPA: DUF6677 family protein [Pyrinomonadaceae bacterium]|nr:DUF6677 family protein [Pyrinomonadaceae bacterium]